MKLRSKFVTARAGRFSVARVVRHMIRCRNWQLAFTLEVNHQLKQSFHAEVGLWANIPKCNHLDDDNHNTELLYIDGYVCM